MIQLSEDNIEKIEYEIEDLEEKFKVEDRGNLQNKIIRSIKWK